MSDENCRVITGWVKVSEQLIDDSPRIDYDRYVVATLARDSGTELDRETAEWLDSINWRPAPISKPTLRQRIRRRIMPMRERLAYLIAPWLPREEEW